MQVIGILTAVSYTHLDVYKRQPIIGVKVAQWQIKQMKTKWGTCNIEAQRIWLNLELAKKSKQCLEYIVVHEMVHLLERHHNDNFIELMNKFMPQWRLHREEMCIRDSNNAVYELLRYGVKVKADVGENTQTAVSYTHLEKSVVWI